MFSFRTANAHTDSLGEVDVIADAEHIKKLLKVSFNKHSQISMIVHRLGRTILLDEFDVHSHLLRLEKVLIKMNIFFFEEFFRYLRMIGHGFEIFFSILFYGIYP